MQKKTLKVEWTEKHYTLENVDVMEDGTIVGIGNAMNSAIVRTGLFSRQHVIPESIHFTIED